MNTVRLEDLVGPHELSGVDFGTIPPDAESYRYESANSITFVLDGHAYCAVEDPSDGYRSSMEHLSEVPIESVTNRFEPVGVVGVYRSQGSYNQEDDILELRDVATGKLVLEVGTENSDDYYPSYVANFTPENMACNQPAKAEGR